MGVIDHAPDENEFVLITGCISRELKDTPSFSGAFNPKIHTREQQYELTKAVAQVMATRIKGKNLATEHDEDGPVGEIVHTWIDDAKNEWYIQAIVDRNSRAGMDVIQALLAENDSESPLGARLGELSLSTEGFDVREASVVIKGARPGSTIDKIELINREQLEAIKKQEYKPIITYTPDHIPEGAPIIRATFGSGMSTGTSYQALKVPAPPSTYQGLQNAPAETAPITNQFEQMRQQQIASQALEQQAMQAQKAKEQQTQQMQMQIDFLQKQLAASQQTALQTPQNFPGNPQFQGLHDKLTNSQPGAPFDGNNHTLYTNPSDDPLMNIAKVLQSGSNVLSNQQKQDLMNKLLQAAQHTKQTKDAAMTAESQLNLLKQKNAELEQKVQKHEGDKTKQQKQTAMILKRLLMKTNPPLNPNEQSDLDTAEQTLAAGQTEKGLELASPFIIRASAFLEAATQSAQAGAQQAQVGNEQVNIVEQMARILQPGTLTQASGFGQVSGRKRHNEEMHSAPSYGAEIPGASAAAQGGSNGMWAYEKYGNLASVFAKAEGLDEGTMRLQDLRS